ncbi:MAG: homoserine kinase [Anaerolineae bacterium]|nr:homoserine kinase [Anaerolineae bacterium]
MTKVRVTVPATSSNLGPGLGCMALALGLHNTVELVELEHGLDFDLQGDNTRQEIEDTAVLVRQAILHIFHKAGYLPGGLHIHLENRIPSGSCLGGDAATLLGGAIAANVLLGSPFTREELLHQVIEIENRPHALLAALLGGLVISSHSDNKLIYKPVQVAPMRVVTVLPEDKPGNSGIDLPQRVNLKDAVFNIGNAALVVQALSTGDIDLLARVMHDRLHEEAHSKSIPGYDQMRQAALKNGAAATAISGTGPALLAFAENDHDEIAKAMARAYRKATQNEAQAWVLPVDTQGISISEMGMSLVEKPIPASDHPVTLDKQKPHSLPSSTNIAHSHTAPQPLTFVPGLEGQIP